MGFFSSYTETVRVTHHSTTFSRATFFNIVILAMAVVCPYLIGYRTQGFWKKFDYVREQPVVEFKHEALLVMDIEKNSTKQSLIWSTFKPLNEMVGTKVTPYITSREGDHNMDGVFEYLDLQILIPMEEQMKVSSFQLFLIFDYKLLHHATVQFEGLAYISHSLIQERNCFNIFADLELKYNSPLWSHIRDERFNKPIIPKESSNIKDYSIRNILRDYSTRNLTTVLKNKYEFMEYIDEASSSSKEFLFKIRINYSEATYECWAGLWNTLKWAWVQYFAIFIIVFTILKTFQRMAYSAKLFETFTLVPWDKRNESKTIISHQQNS